MGYSFPALDFLKTGILQSEAVKPTPTPNLEDQTSVFVTPGDRVTQLFPQAQGTHFSSLSRHA
jgi:hypothetical protein